MSSVWACVVSVWAFSETVLDIDRSHSESCALVVIEP